MRSAFVIFCVLAATASTISAQIKGHTEPGIKLACPESVVVAGNSFKVAVTAEPKFTEKQTAAVTYNWTVSWGTIAKGAGTDTITIEPGEGTGTITATVEIENIWFKTITKSCTAYIQALPVPRLYDEFRFYNQGYVKMVFDGFMVDLDNNPASQGYVVIYPETDRHYRQIVRIIRAWAGTRRFDISRITLIRAEKNPKSVIQMWMIPAGAENPEFGLRNPEPVK
ncbi:MAG: hypothetical protein H7070_12675 [Saprospiraceae bacterium]|nr:hypothetical protein [Pyrinomonadaceae bacterium]